MNLKILFLALVLLAAIVPVSATITITSETGSSYIGWSWLEGIAATNASIDGVYISDFDPSGRVFVLSGLQSNETHKFCVYSESDSGCSTATTAQDNSIFARITGDAMLWFYVILILAVFLFGKVLHWIFFLLGSGISLYALATYLIDNPVITTDIFHLQFYIYCAFFLLGIYLWGNKKGVW